MNAPPSRALSPVQMIGEECESRSLSPTVILNVEATDVDSFSRSRGQIEANLLRALTRGTTESLMWVSRSDFLRATYGPNQNSRPKLLRPGWHPIPLSY